MQFTFLFSVCLLCITACAALGRKSRWYIAAWLPLLLFTLFGLLGLLGASSMSVGHGPEGGFAAMGKASAIAFFLPAIILAPFLWFARPQGDPNQMAAPLVLGVMIPVVTFLAAGLTMYDKIPVRVFDGQGRLVSNQYIKQDTTENGISKEGPTATTDTHGLAQIKSLNWQRSTFKTSHSDGYGVEITWHDLPKGGGVWSSRWAGTMFFGMELEAVSPDKPTIDLYIRKWDELEMPVLVEQIRQTVERARRSNAALLPDFGGCPESLQFIQELTRLSQDSPPLRASIAKILTSQAAMIESFLTIVKSQASKNNQPAATSTIQALIIWATQQDQVSSESIQALQLKLTQTGQQILEAALPLIGDRYGSYQAFAHLKDLAIPYLPQILERFPSAEENGQAMMLHLFRELDLGFKPLEPFAKDASPGFAMTILMAVQQWQNLEEISEALAIVEAKEKEFQGKDHPNRMAVEGSFRFAREQLQWATQKMNNPR